MTVLRLLFPNNSGIIRVGGLKAARDYSFRRTGSTSRPNREEHHAYLQACCTRPGFGGDDRNVRRRERPGTEAQDRTEGAYPPFNNLTSDGKLEGFDIDIARALCEEMKAECEFVTQDWDGIIRRCRPASSTPSSPPCPYHAGARREGRLHAQVLTTPRPPSSPPRTTDIKGVTKEDLAGKTIGVQGSTTHFNYSKKTYTDSTVKAYPSAQEYQLDLANGRLDAAMTTSPSSRNG